MAYKEGSPEEEASESASEAKKEGDAPKGKLGSGTRFKALTKALGSKGAKDPGAIAAAAGMAKYGKAKFEAMAQAGRKRAEGK